VCLIVCDNGISVTQPHIRRWSQKFIILEYENIII